MNIVNSITRVLRDCFLASGRMHTRAVLLAMSDRELEDKGFSREKLEAGIHSWPWRKDGTGENASIDHTSPDALRRATEVLESYSDRELADLGISRADIPAVVRHRHLIVEEVIETEKVIERTDNRHVA